MKVEALSENSLPDGLVQEYLSRRLDRRTLLERAAALGLTASAASALLAACGGEDEDQKGGQASNVPQGSRSLTVLMPLAMGNTDPNTNSSGSPIPVMEDVYERLVAFKPTLPGQARGETYNVLAESLEVSDDGRRVAFTLKQGIEFHGGYGELTAEDVKFSFERAAGIQKLYTNAAKDDVPYYSGDWAGLERVRVQGKYAGEIVFKEPFAPFLTVTLPSSSTGYVVSKKAVEALGRKRWPANPIGTGPYRQASLKVGKEGTLELFDGYGGAASEFQPSYPYGEITVLLASPAGIGSNLTVPLETGEIDADLSTAIRPRDANRLREGGRITVYEVQSPFSYNLIFVNVQHPKLQDKRVRQALRYAIDVPGLIALSEALPETRANALIAEQMGVGYWPDAPRYDRDITRAKDLLEQAGASDLELELCASGKPAAELIQANLAEVGVKAKIVLATLPESPLPEGWGSDPNKSQLIHILYGGAPDPYWQFQWYTCEQVGIWNWSFLCNKEYDRLFAQLGRELDPAKRTELAIQMQKLMDDSAGFVWLNVPTLYFASQQSLQLVFNAAGNPYLKNTRAL